ncbi:MAG: alpha/beta hydrolase [Candidatus Dormibacteraeota bacterium]|nr:alpha/beta hydrolase [Candidatus Dormibacteraeota bacterium]
MRQVTLQVVTSEDPAAHVIERGDGKPVLLLHGWGTSAELFVPIFDGLQSERRLIAPDLPGFGDTPPPAQPWSVHEYARWVVALLDRLGVDRCDVIGHSNGGRIGIVLAATYPERVRRIVLTDSSGIRPRRGLRYRYLVATYKALRRTQGATLLPRALRDAAQRRADRRGSDDFRAASGAMRATLVRLVNEDITPTLPRVAAPTLLIWGERDADTPLRDAQLMERLIPDAGLVVFEGAGHFAYLEQPARFCTVVDVFLQDPA